MNAVYKVITEITSKNSNIAQDVKGKRISCLYGCSGILVDEKINPVGPCLICMDRRAEDQVVWVKENIDLQELFEVTGNYVDSYYGYIKIMWYRDNKPQI